MRKEPATGSSSRRRRLHSRRTPRRQRLAHSQPLTALIRSRPLPATNRSALLIPQRRLGRTPRIARRSRHSVLPSSLGSELQRHARAVGSQRSDRRSTSQRGRHLDLLGSHARDQAGHRERGPERAHPRGRCRLGVGPRALVESHGEEIARRLGLGPARALLGQRAAEYVPSREQTYLSRSGGPFFCFGSDTR